MTERPPYLPGDPPPDRDSMIRVDHAGEYGAVRIYDGQLAATRHGRARDEIRLMAQQEKRHLAEFDMLVRTRHVRPTVLSPLWHVMGYALGAMTALFGERAAMACTVAVEEVIDAHYREQAEKLGADEKPLQQTIEKFRAEEVQHRDTGLAHGAEQAAAYPVLTQAIKAGSRLAIWLAERV